MNDVIRLHERQSGNLRSSNYDVALRRFRVHESDGWKGIAPPMIADINPEPPIFSSKFANFGQNKHILAISNEDGMIALQDTNLRKSAPESEKMLNGQQCHNNAVFDLEWMPGDMKFVSASGDHSAKLWDVRDSNFVESRVFKGHSRSVKTAAFRKTDSAVFATGGRDGAIYIWDTRTNCHVGSMSRADNCILSGHAGGPGTPQSHRRRPATRMTPKLPPNISTNSITGLVFQDDYSLISCGAGDGIIKVWDLRRNYGIKKEPQPKYSISYPGTSALKGYSNLLIDHTGLRLYVNCLDNNIYCYNLATYSPNPIMQYVGLVNKSFYIKSSLSPDGQYLLSGSSEEKAYIWNVNNSQPLVALCGHRAEVTCVAWSHTKDLRVVTCSEDARHRVWRVGPEFIGSDQSELYPGYAEGCKEYMGNKLKVRLKGLLNTPRSLKRLMERNETTPSTAESCGTKRSFHEMTEDLHCYEASEPKRQHIETKGRRLFSPASTSTSSSRSNEVGFSTNLASILEEIDPQSELHTHLRSPNKYESSPTKQNPKILLSPLSERLNRNLLSPDMSSSSGQHRSTESTIVFSPTLNLPNYVINGEAPHLIAQSPKRKLKENVKSDWLTTMRKQKLMNSRQITAKLSDATQSSQEVSADESILSPRAVKSSEHSPRVYAIPKRRTSRCGSNESAAPRTPTSRRNSILNFFSVMQSPNQSTSRIKNVAPCDKATDFSKDMFPLHAVEKVGDGEMKVKKADRGAGIPAVVEEKQPTA
ncbi:Protein lethal(2)denticleless [Pseudolycoriella hygida]|uniref:Protein lethal(2)denticleless n=1 Tax=Pseudolycoriella hygida TaxID=35572 RepID=A0A9Q0N7M3_9DIPT|nr:Protein lethal(2)denticleless [Pseudolycoriella hygida]